MPARCTIDGTDVPLSQVMKRVMNFGQPVATRPSLPYCIVVPRDEFFALLDAAHRRTRQELINDEPYDDGTDDAVNALRAAGWPTSLEVIEPELMGRYVRRFLVTELLDGLATAPPPGEFQLNTLDSVSLVGGDVELRGTCYA